MKPTVFLRIASVLTFIHGALHTIGGVFGKPAPGIGAATYSVMQGNYFQVLGVTRSYAEFYRGLGLGVTIVLTAEGLLFWLLGSLAKKNAVELRPILRVFALAYLAFAVNSYTYFFNGPVFAEILIAGCLVGAIVTAKPVVTSAVPFRRKRAMEGERANPRASGYYRSHISHRTVPAWISCWPPR